MTGSETAYVREDIALTCIGVAAITIINDAKHGVPPYFDIMPN